MDQMLEPVALMMVGRVNPGSYADNKRVREVFALADTPRRDKATLPIVEVIVRNRIIPEPLKALDLGLDVSGITKASMEFLTSNTKFSGNMKGYMEKSKGKSTKNKKKNVVDKGKQQMHSLTANAFNQREEKD